MKAARVLRFGPPNVIVNDDLSRPEPAAGQLLVRIKAAGVGNWDALIREGKIELRVLKPGGILVSVVSPVPETTQKSYGVRAAYFYVDVTTARLNKIAELFDSGKLVTDVGTVLPLEEARIAHEMLGGTPHKRGKIVLSIAAESQDRDACRVRHATCAHRT